MRLFISTALTVLSVSTIFSAPASAISLAASVRELGQSEKLTFASLLSNGYEGRIIEDPDFQASGVRPVKLPAFIVEKIPTDLKMNGASSIPSPYVQEKNLSVFRNLQNRDVLILVSAVSHGSDSAMVFGEDHPSMKSWNLLLEHHYKAVIILTLNTRQSVLQHELFHVEQFSNWPKYAKLAQQIDDIISLDNPIMDPFAITLAIMEAQASIHSLEVLGDQDEKMLRYLHESYEKIDSLVRSMTKGAPDEETEVRALIAKELPGGNYGAPERIH